MATITGDPKKAKASDYADLNFDEKRIHIYPIDIDAHASSYAKTIMAEGFELESQPEYREQLTEGEMYLSISEDDFELLAEALTEFLENDDEDDGEDTEPEDDILLMDDDEIVV